MARQSSGRRNADDHETGDDDLDRLADADDLDDADSDDAGGPVRDAATDALWADVRIDPVEIALPGGTGYTLRAYRPVAELTPTEAAEEEDDPFAALHGRPDPDAEDDWDIDEEAVELEEDLPERAAGTGRARRRATDDEDDLAEIGDEPLAEVDEEDADEVDEEDAAAEAEDVPIFLGRRGKLHLFRTPESLVEFVSSGAEHDLAQLDTWPELVERLRPEHVVPLPADSYELDLVVENLRGGHDAWDTDLLIQAGELARDLGYALRMEPLLAALSAGSPLDDMDEALRGAASGGVSGFFARRRLRKIGAQQATLGWRTIIGKISGAVVWRE